MSRACARPTCLPKVTQAPKDSAESCRPDVPTRRYCMGDSLGTGNGKHRTSVVTMMSMGTGGAVRQAAKPACHAPCGNRRVIRSPALPVVTRWTHAPACRIQRSRPSAIKDSRLPTPRQPRFHRRLACAIAVGAMLLLGGCRTMLFGALNRTDQHKDIEVERNLPFAPAQHLSLDVYLPAHMQHAPVVVFFYGGDWTHGKREWYRFVGTALAAKGVIAVIPDYRKYPRVGLDGFMQDAAHAVAWAHQHAASLGGDPQDLFVMGHSSGAQIAGLLATDPSWLAADGVSLHDLAGFIGLAGVYDFVPLPKRETGMRHLFGKQASALRRA